VQQAVIDSPRSHVLSQLKDSSAAEAEVPIEFSDRCNQPKAAFQRPYRIPLQTLNKESKGEKYWKK